MIVNFVLCAVNARDVLSSGRRKKLCKKKKVVVNCNLVMMEDNDGLTMTDWLTVLK